MESNLILVGEEVSSLHNQIELSGNSISFDLRQANRAHSILIVQDVDQGPSPVHQSIISQLDDTLLDRVIWMTVGITKHTDPELLELEALEILELFASAGLDGDQILFGYDSNAVKLQFPLPQMSLIGIKQLNNTLLNRTDQIYSNEFPTRKD